ncbi:type IV pilus modification PilV family protein [Gloeobacter kilaueensis]|uniref:Uncharacterized protein n=1 Tax=Gloeobacter kilaueensis (strain ATCC BAA-2537 / CCAP 1431/1 / ULC 316 / JS1) TaxID=1183438 RepID=U5QMQ0_GLOK1|nr:prepilin-type N-terminal cleavage/methylation domain-containing protein [Gloeobacter kilaueensis]AGY58854.1 hypothetical protein GKIL_2608 [Gloeobacter kilaueensis JS1]
MLQLKVRRRNRRGVTVIELTIAMIVLIFLALASFFTLSNLSSDSKAEASVSVLEKMRLWGDTVLAKGVQTDFDNFNTIQKPEDQQVQDLKKILGDNFRPQNLQVSLAALCANANVPGNLKNRVSAALGLSSPDGQCPANLPTAGFGEGQYPTPANTGGTASPFYIAP